MTVEELVAEINHLSLDEHLEILEKVSRNTREELKASQRSQVPVELVWGLLKTSEPPPDDNDLKGEYTNYLEAKYS